jgi:flagellar motor switch protein FliN/FliY
MATTTGPRAAEQGGTSQGGSSDVFARVAQFAELTGRPGEAGAGGLEGLQDVTVTVAAELGRVTLTIGEVLKLGVGSVLELHRSINEPVDLMVQGVRLARGEVVVVDDRFAIRIREITEPKKRP